MKIGYKTTFLLFYCLSIAILLLTFYFLNSVYQESNIYDISNNNFKIIKENKEKYISNFIEEYKKPLNAISNNQIFKNYINNIEDEKNSNQLFLALLDTLPYVFQIRYIDINAYEKIKVIKNYFDKNKTTQILLTKDLENKSTRDYFKQFLEIKENNFGISNIDLNIDNGKITNPKMATLRITKVIFDKNKQKKGFLVVNILVDKLFHDLQENDFFNIYLIDKKGRFLLHKDKNFGIYSNNFNTYLLKNKIKNELSESILSKNEFSYPNYFSQKINIFNQDIILLYESKYNTLKQDTESKRLQILYILIIISVIALPFVFYYSRVPEKLTQKIISQFITDDITKLPNSEHLFKDLKEEKFENDLVILLKIKNDKSIQNIYGFSVLKEYLKELTDIFEKFKESDKNFQKIYKIKHNVFAFKYNYTNLSTLNNSLKELQDMLESKEIIIFESYDISNDFVIGVSGIKKINNNINELKEAEIALDQASKFNQSISIFNEEHIKNLTKYKSNIEKIKIIKEAILKDGVLIAFQPIYNNFSKKVEKYEVLIRLKYQDKIYYPDEFLQIAKKIKKYKVLTKIVMKKTFEYFKDKDFEFSINLSMEDINDEDLRTYLFKQIKEYKLQNKLVIELVETEAIQNYDLFTTFIKKIKKLNCKIAIDDFGSGYSNYEYIIKLSDYIDYLKIDGSLIIDIDKNKKTQLLVGTLKFLCDNLKIKTIAEYVENKEVFDFINAMNISYSQGYYIGKPEFELKVNDKLEKEKNLDYF